MIIKSNAIKALFWAELGFQNVHKATFNSFTVIIYPYLY